MRNAWVFLGLGITAGMVACALPPVTGSFRVQQGGSVFTDRPDVLDTTVISGSPYPAGITDTPGPEDTTVQSGEGGGFRPVYPLRPQPYRFDPDVMMAQPQVSAAPPPYLGRRFDQYMMNPQPLPQPPGPPPNWRYRYYQAE